MRKEGERNEYRYQKMAPVGCKRFFFVKEAWHRKGIGKQLFDAVKRDYEIQEFTVNSSPYAVEVYRHLGFIPTASEQITNGIRYTPMRYRAENCGEQA
ncbi:GNAT family N-acetyltransferase [Faecalicatena contorta]|uniref:GNAT family N-acetyltransferase n=1 Tax=Faecalicatena contorta TaxID=39482 RepID=UPI001F25C98D|nr:GNAT family N-acetyltransferase [Faecalicatena contorta]MCF2681811.1 GNAT family N-acetyltransferase [Faecalicatena contorta]